MVKFLEEEIAKAPFSEEEERNARSEIQVCAKEGGEGSAPNAEREQKEKERSDWPHLFSQ